MKISAIVPAAGASTRMGADVRKPFLELAGESILQRTCRRLRAMPGVEEIVLAVHAEDRDRVERDLWESLSQAGVTLIVAGGENRAASVWNALAACDPEAELVAVHDAVRPFLVREVWDEIVRQARARGAAVPMVPASDTIKRIEADRVSETLRRRGLVRIQTPQIFERSLLIEANEYVLSTGGFSDAITDDASILEAFGKEVAVVLGVEYTFKITTPRDLRMAEALLQAGVAEG